MDHFVVSARKYRPSTFETVVGQTGITTTLKNAIKSKHLAQAFLFCGPRGVGKTTCARILAKTINCTNLTPETEGCNQCESCISFNNGQSLNIYELDAASNNSVDDIRNLVEQVRYPPHSGRYKIYIIDEVHMLSASAFNAFLKTLEEPPSYAIFILATTEKHKIIPTILSRCQIFDFNRITLSDIADHLKWVAGQESVTAEPEALHMIAQKADGALRDALSIFDQIVSFAGNQVTYKHVIDNLNILDYDYYFRLTDLFLQGNFPDALLLLDEVINEGFEIHHFILGLGNHFRDLLVSKEPKTVQLLEVGPSTRDRYRSQAGQCSIAMLFNWLDIANRCDVDFKNAQNQRLHLEIAMLKMSLPQATPGMAQDSIPVANTKSGAVANNPVQVKETKTTIPAVAEPTPSATATPSVPKPSPAASPAPDPVKPSANPTTTVATPATGRTLSINKKLSSMKEPEASRVSEPEVKEETNSFTSADMLKYLKAYSEKVKSEGRMQLAVTLSSHPAVLLENNVIEIPVENTIQAEEIKDVKQDLVVYLRKALSNSKIDVIARVVENNEINDTAYTPMEKFKKMAEKNPDLNQLRQQFDLELDF